MSTLVERLRAMATPNTIAAADRIAVLEAEREEVIAIWKGRRIRELEADQSEMLVEATRLIGRARMAESDNTALRADNRALRASWDELQRDNLRLTDERDKLKLTVEQSDRDYVAVKAERDAAEAERDRLEDLFAAAAAGRAEAEAERDAFRAHSIDLTADCHEADSKIEALTAERDRLRQALTEIAGMSEGPPDEDKIYNEIIARGLDSTDADQSIGAAGAYWRCSRRAAAALAPFPSAGQEGG